MSTFMDAEHAAKRCGISLRQFRRHIASGHYKIRTICFNKYRHLFLVEEIDQAIRDAAITYTHKP